MFRLTAPTLIFLTAGIIGLAMVLFTLLPVSFFSNRSPFSECQSLHIGKVRVSISYPADFEVFTDDHLHIRLYAPSQIAALNSGDAIYIVAIDDMSLIWKPSTTPQDVVDTYAFERPERQFHVSSLNSIPAAKVTGTLLRAR